MHWADVVAARLLKRGPSHHIASGTSISGRIHLGNAGDVIYADGIARAVRDGGGQAEVLWIADDVDPLRAVPEQMPASFSEHLGKPVSSLPDLEGCHGAMTDHFIEPFLESLRGLGIQPTEKRGSRMYAAGEYDEAIAAALTHADDIRAILAEVSGSKKPAGWLPFDPICKNCGRIATTDAVAWKGKEISYTCGGGVAGRKEMQGCGHEGTASFHQGKLPWRVEWAARWKILGVTCEPFGKEHAAAGGSYDTSKVIVERVFHYPPPEPVHYEYIVVGGAKMAKSKGNVMALQELLDVLPPEAVRYFYFRTEPNKHKDFDPRTKLLPLAEEAERARAIVGGRVKPSAREDADLMRRALELSQVREREPVDYGDLPFGHLVYVAQIAPTPAEARAVLARIEAARTAEGGEAPELLERRMAWARAFADRYVAPEDRTRIIRTTSEVPLSSLPSGTAAFFKAFAHSIETGPWQAERIHNAVFDAAKSAGVAPGDAFRAIYLALIGQERGPRAGFFIASMDRAFAVRRFEELAARA